MSSLPQIKWHAQELHKLLSQYPNDSMLADVYVKLEALILNDTRFKDINASPPTMGDDPNALTNE